MFNRGYSVLTRLVLQYRNAQTNSGRCAAISMLMWDHQQYIDDFRQALIKLDDYEQLAELDEMVDSYRPRRAVRVHMSQEEMLKLLRERKK